MVVDTLGDLLDQRFRNELGRLVGGAEVAPIGEADAGDAATGAHHDHLVAEPPCRQQARAGPAPLEHDIRGLGRAVRELDGCGEQVGSGLSRLFGDQTERL